MTAVLEHMNIAFERDEVLIKNSSSSWPTSDTDLFVSKAFVFTFLS